MALRYSFIIPVYNRPDEVRELLHSIKDLDFDEDFEVVIVEDGSTESSEAVVEKFSNSLNITYLPKYNTGPGDSRNYGMRNAKGNYFLILDSEERRDLLFQFRGLVHQPFGLCVGNIYGNAKLLKETRNRALATTYSAGKTYNFHIKCWIS